MTTMLDDVIQNLLDRLETEPDNRYLIRVAYDALLEAGREKEAVEIECRCWLKAKKRVPDAIGGRWFFHLETSEKKYAYQSDLRKAVVPDDLTFAEGDTVDRWLKLSRERQDELWLWEPPT